MIEGCFVVQATIVLQPTWTHSLTASYEGDVYATNLLSHLAIDSLTHKGYAIKKGILYYKDKLYVTSGGNLRSHLLALYGHYGIQATYLRLKRHFY